MYCQVLEDKDVSNTPTKQVVDAICCGPTGNLQGTCGFFTLDTMQKIVRPQFTVIPMPKSVIQCFKWISEYENSSNKQFKEFIEEGYDPHVTGVEEYGLVNPNKPSVLTTIPEVEEELSHVTDLIDEDIELNFNTEYVEQNYPDTQEPYGRFIHGLKGNAYWADESDDGDGMSVGKSIGKSNDDGRSGSGILQIPKTQMVYYSMIWRVMLIRQMRVMMGMAGVLEKVLGHPVMMAGVWP